MNNKAAVVTLCSTLFALCVSAEAQKTPRIGFVSGGASSTSRPTLKAFQQGLRDLGYLEGKNILVEFRYAEGKPSRFANLVAELVQLKVDVLVSNSTPAVRAAKKVTKTIPIVMVITQDPVAAGLIDSLARPGGNITGLTRLARELSGKRLELLKEMIPGLSRVGVLWSADDASAIGDYEAAARTLKISLESLEVRGPKPDLEGAFREATRRRTSALIVVRGAVINPYRNQIAELAIKNRLPSMYESSSDVERGGLVSYSADETESYRRAAYYVDKILKGAKVTELPVEQPMKFELVINLKTAKKIGLTIPQWTLMKADRVIK